jgi:benzoyl-CoA reductase subunit B
MDLSPIPRLGGDWPMYLGPLDAERDKAFINHIVYNYLSIIYDIERIFDTEFDDEKLIGNLNWLSKMREHALRITQLMTHTPCPIGQKELHSFYTLGMLTKVDPQETLDFWKSFADEVQWRVDNNIAAVANERYRWLEAHPSPWHFLKYFRHMEKYGAVCIGSQYSHFIAGPVELKPDGTLGSIAITPPPKDQPIRTREDAFRYIFTEARGYRFKDDEYFRKDRITDFAKAFHVDGAIMPPWRSGVECTLTRKEQGLRLNGIGVRVLHYEGSHPGDRTDLDEHDFIDRLDE